jgi:hypothetical protein
VSPPEHEPFVSGLASAVVSTLASAPSSEASLTSAPRPLVSKHPIADPIAKRATEHVKTPSEASRGIARSVA